jgi:hypothetical protein
MRLVMSIALLALLLAGLAPAFSAIAQEGSLRDLLPTAEEIGPGFVEVDNRARPLADQATGFADANGAARLLAEWRWQENVFQVFQSASQTPGGAPAATVDISLTRFASAEDAAAALPYFLEDRAAVLGEREIPNPGRIGDEARAIDGHTPQGYDLTLFTRSGPLLLRVSSTSATGAPAAAPDRIARGIFARVIAEPTPVLLTQSAAAYLPETLPLADAGCFRIAGQGDLDLPGIVERLAGLADAEATLRDLGWVGGVYRQFACDAAPGSAGWVDVSVSRFGEARAAADAVTLFADARARGMKLNPAPALELGESRAAITGPAVNGTEFTLYLSSGPLLFAVTGVAPSGDPRRDVETIGTALYDLSLANPAPEESAPPVMEPAPAPTATPALPPAPTIAPMPTATPLPTAAPIPTAPPPPPATFTPTPTPIVPTETPVPDTIPVQVPEAQPTPPPPTSTPAPLPTATTSAPPTPTPRVIRPPSSSGG